MHINNQNLLYHSISLVLITIRKKMLIAISGPLSGDIVVYYTISAIVAVFIICICFVVYKCRTGSKTTIRQSKITSLPRYSKNVTNEERVYNIIVDEDMLDDESIQKMQMEMSSEFVDSKK